MSEKITPLWPQYPVIYEINTWVWLKELSGRTGEQVTLNNVPQTELERLAGFGFDGIWLMGVWLRSPGARRVALTYPGWQTGFKEALAGLIPEDVVGSAYAILDYQVDPAIGGNEGLALFRERLQKMGLCLMLDFVPNHMAVDHSWLQSHPYRFVQGDTNLLAEQPANYFISAIEGYEHVFAHGRDPYFDGWPDTVQIDYRHAETRRKMSDVLLSIAEQCDGVRCDMAMLLTHDIFLKTWGGQFDPPEVEFWPAAMTDLKARNPDFLTLAEVYWDMEWQMQQQGFDYTYDKRLYDRLLRENAESVRGHLQADINYQKHLARFIENHDEQRAIAAFGIEHSKAAAVLALTLPGLRLVHEGQITGNRIKLPVHLGRRQIEPPIEGLETFYRILLANLRDPVFHIGEWRLLNPTSEGLPDKSYRNVIAHQWTHKDQIRIIVVNLSQQTVNFQLPFDQPSVSEKDWILHDELNDVDFPCSGDQLSQDGLFFELPAYGYHLLTVNPI